MTAMKIVSYLRVSTAKQGHIGLGLAAQLTSIACYAQQRNATSEFYPDLLDLYELRFDELVASVKPEGGEDHQDESEAAQSA